MSDITDVNNSTDSNNIPDEDKQQQGNKCIVDDLESELNNLNGTNDLQDMLHNLSNDENITSLFKQFSSGFSNFAQSNENINEEEKIEEESDELDFETLNLDKYLLSSEGTNLCDILGDIKNELVKLNKNLNK